jgi:hypothetical protein
VDDTGGWGLIVLIFIGAALHYTWKQLTDEGDVVGLVVGLLFSTQPVRRRASQTRSWISSLTRPGWRCGVDGRSSVHAPDARSCSEAWR